LLSETNDGYPVLKLNRLSMEVLRNQRSVEIASAPVRQQKTGAGDRMHQDTKDRRLEPEEMKLFRHLRNLRKVIADEQRVPPYVVFPDSSLQAMAQQRPQSEEHFAKIPGVGSRKLEAYFTPFTEEIRAYCELHNLVMGLERTEEVKGKKKEEATAPQISRGPSTHWQTLELYKVGRSIEEIARERNLKPGTIMSHLVELIEAGENVDVERLISPEREKVIFDALQAVGGEVLRPVKDVLGDDYSYDEIRLVRALMRVSRRDDL